MGDIEFKRGQIYGACLAGSSVTRTASLYGVSRAMVSIMSAYGHKTTSNRSESEVEHLLLPAQTPDRNIFEAL